MSTPGIDLVVLEVTGASLARRSDAPIQGRVGEARAAYMTANRLGIPVWPGEPSDDTIVARLVDNGVSLQDVLASYVTRRLRAATLYQSNGTDPEELLHAAASAQAAYRREVDSFKHVSLDYRRWYLQHMGMEPGNDPLFAERGSPCGPGRASEIVHQISEVRNRHIVAVIEAALRKDDDVAVVYGAGHYWPLHTELVEQLGAPTFDQAVH